MCASLFASTLQEFEKSLAQMLAAASSLLMIVTSRNRALFASHNLTGRSMEIQQLARGCREDDMAVCSVQNAKGGGGRAGCIVRQHAHCVVGCQQLHCQLSFCSKGTHSTVCLSACVQVLCLSIFVQVAAYTTC